jgi:streptogramin lyase
MPSVRSLPQYPHRGLEQHSCKTLFLALAWLALTTAQAQTTTYALGTSALLVGPASGTNTVVLAVTPANGAWTATTNATWLHLTAANQSGTGSTNLVFSYDASPGATRSGTLTISGQTLTVTQAGSTYIAAEPVTTLVSPPGAIPTGELPPLGMAVDGAGNVYSADNEGSFGVFEIEEWEVTNNIDADLIFGHDYVQGVAVDGAGNVYLAAPYGNTIFEWTGGNGAMTTLVSSGLNLPGDVAVDGAGNVYIADAGTNAIKEWTAVSSNVTTLVSSGLSNPSGVAVDAAGNVYIADSGNNAIKEWTAANSNVTVLVSSGLNDPLGVAVDGAGNVYIEDTGNSAIKEWTAANSNVTTLVSSGLSSPHGLAVDGAGNVYIDDTGTWEIKELPYAFVDPTARSESRGAGSDALPVVLPVTENLLAPFNPTSDQSWLTIGGITNGVVSFSFTATASNRTANITLLGQTIPITQGVPGTPPTLGSVQMLGKGILRFAFTNNPGAVFTVLSTTNLSLPLSDWTVAGTATNMASGLFLFTSPPTTNDAQRFYGVRSP